MRGPRRALVGALLHARAPAVHGRVDAGERPRGGALQRVVHDAVGVGDRCDERARDDLRVPAREPRLRRRSSDREPRRVGGRVPRLSGGRPTYGVGPGCGGLRLAPASGIALSGALPTAGSDTRAWWIVTRPALGATRTQP